ncbi:MAG: hypothetical protein DRI80_11105, partial [Chloroflexota bacterium]
AWADVDAVGIVGEVGRGTGPGGMRLSVEPRGERFDREKWTGLLTEAGFEVSAVERFFEMQISRGESEHHALAVGTRRAS